MSVGSSENVWFDQLGFLFFKMHITKRELFARVAKMQHVLEAVPPPFLPVIFGQAHKTEQSKRH